MLTHDLCPLHANAMPQEVKFKSYYHDLHWALTEYDRVVTEVHVVLTVTSF